jgi:hypothetical protein
MATFPSRTLRALTPDQRAALMDCSAYGLAAVVVAAGLFWLIAVTFPAWLIACAISQGICW